MKMSQPASTYWIGIDLGTTHTVLSYCERGRPDIFVFNIPQWVTATQIAKLPILPSFLYAPLPGEIGEDPFGDAPWVIGEYARLRGGEVFGRTVTSSKSWLCHAAVDRGAPILPWGTDDDDLSNTGGAESPHQSQIQKLQKISPIEAAARILTHLKHAWDKEHPHHRLQHQEIVLTIPASFDEAARELTLRAAEQAGLPHVRLLEEPQAAFYECMRNLGPNGLETLCKPGETSILFVCDIGGGTTDLSLIQIDRREEKPKTVRIAVGRHLLLGGDNMDLALAHACERQWYPPEAEQPQKRLGPARFAQLVIACRSAKEKLLGEPDKHPSGVPITLLGSGSNLFKSRLSTNLGREETEQILLNGFFPRVDFSAAPQKTRGGLQAFGLPYERDAAVTRHVAEFLRKHLPPGQHPSALLLNGGVFLSAQIQRRIHKILSEWQAEPLTLLPHGDPELSVARGAVVFAQSLHGQGDVRRVESGTAHGYYIGLKTESKNEAPQAVCVVPKGAKEGQRHIAEGRAFGLSLGRKVRFDAYASSDAQVHAPGELVTIDDERFIALPPLVTAIPTESAKGKAKAGEEVRVHLSGELSAVGTLELACIEAGTEHPRRFRLAFQIRRDEEAEAPADTKETKDTKKTARGGRALEEAKSAIAAVFSKDAPEAVSRELKDLVRNLERILGNRSDWTLESARTLFDTLWSFPKARRRSAEHERIFWQLAGFCLRPGFGDPLDEPRAAGFGALFAEKLAFPQETRNWQQFWIAYRRVTGGLPENTQVLIRDTLDPLFAPPEKKLKKPKGFKPEAFFDMLELVSSLERVPAERRAELGAWILERTWTERDDRLWAALGRIGARVPAYASAHHVVSPKTAERWLDHLLREKWDAFPSAARAAMRMARVTGDRARDISERIRKDVAARLTKAGARPEWVQAVTEYVPVEQEERAAFFGDALPVGLRLLETN